MGLSNLIEAFRAGIYEFRNSVQPIKKLTKTTGEQKIVNHIR